MRADARRNQERILAATRAQFAEHGSGVAMDLIAKSAGVAVGTLYRHYPTKNDLIQAVLTEFTNALVNRTQQAAASLARPGDAMARIEQLLTDFLQEAATNKAVKAAATVLDATRTTPEQDDRGRAALQTLIEAAQGDGELRPKITPDDVFLMMITAPTSLPGEARERWLGIVLAGMRRA